MTVFFIDRFIYKGKIDIPLSNIKALQDKARECGVSFLESLLGGRVLQDKVLQDKPSKCEKSFFKSLKGRKLN